MRKAWFLVVLASMALWAAGAPAREIVVRGEMDGRMDFAFSRTIEFPGGASVVECSFVAPAGFVSPTYTQEIEAFSLEFSPEPDSKTIRRDERGNEIVTAKWTSPPRAVEMTYAARTRAAARLEPIETDAPFPLRRAPKDVVVFLQATDMVQARDPDIQQTARALTQDADTEFEAVSRVVNWVTDHIRYVSAPERYDAVYSLKTGRGNCQNYSHLTAALLRAVEIPARIVNGFTVKNPYDVRADVMTYTFRSGQGRHSWIEVWFPDLGWVPFDPQKTSLFVSTRFLRIEVGLDNQETQNDGRVRWIAADGAGKPRLNSVTTADLPQDAVALSGRVRDSGLRNILLYPEVEAAAHPEPVKPEPEPGLKPEPKPEPPAKVELPPAARPKPDLPAPKSGQAAVLGNLEFPANVDFADYGEPVKLGEDEFVLNRNFMVETAEYVTTKATQFAQVFQVKRPLAMTRASLALHRFGGGGSLWVEVYEDADGQPGELVASSDLLDVRLLSLRPGYRWADFNFRSDPVKLAPGAYWIALGFSGDPVVNWYFTPGKSVGPAWGTRYKGVFERRWSGALDFEFNYRVQGVYR